MAGTAAASVASITTTVDEAAFRPVHAWLFLAAVGGTLLDGVSVFMTGLAVPLLRAQFAMGPLEVGLLGSALVLGAVFGAMLGGHLADRLGRKDVFLADMALLAVAALILVLADSMAWVLAGQLLVGIAIGMDFPAASAYVAETMPAAERQKMVVGTITFQAVGMVLASLLGVWLLQQSGSAEAWRWLFGCPGGPRDRVLRPAPLHPREPALAGSARASGRRHPGGAPPQRPRHRPRRRAPSPARPAPRHQEATAPCSAPPSCGSPSSPPAPGSSWTSRPTGSASSRP